MGALVPPVALVLAWLGGLAVVDHASAPVATLVMPLYAAIIVLGAAGVYPAMRRRGAGVGVAAAGALAVPLLWIAKECRAMSRLYTPGEAAYYAVNPVALGLLAAAAAQMAAAELLLRRRRTGRWSVRNGPGFLLMAITLIAGLAALVTRHAGPTSVFWTYVQGHRRLFGDGT